MTHTKPADSAMPVLFIGHGSPMNAIEDNEFSRSWAEIARRLPVPQAILCVSAHWETRGAFVTAMAQPQTIHDFRGFPRALFEMQYPAPGAPQFAALTQATVRKTNMQLDHTWGLDHGTWSVLTNMYPEATIPTYQLSLYHGQPPHYHYELAQELQALRKQGVLIIGSGNIVHNLRMMQFDRQPFDWAIELDTWAKNCLVRHDHEALLNYDRLGQTARLAVPTLEHYLPLLYVIGLQERDEPLAFACERIVLGSVSMRTVIVGETAISG